MSMLCIELFWLEIINGRETKDNIEVKPILEHKEYDVGEIPDASDQLKK